MGAGPEQAEDALHLVRCEAVTHKEMQELSNLTGLTYSPLPLSQRGRGAAGAVRPHCAHHAQPLRSKVTDVGHQELSSLRARSPR